MINVVVNLFYKNRSLLVDCFHDKYKLTSCVVLGSEGLLIVHIHSTPLAKLRLALGQYTVITVYTTTLWIWKFG